MTKISKVVGVFGPPNSPSPHNLSSILKPKQVLALNVRWISQIANAVGRDGSQWLQHAVLPTLPPILQSHSRKFMALQYRQWSTLQQPVSTSDYIDSISTDIRGNKIWQPAATVRITCDATKHNTIHSPSRRTGKRVWSTEETNTSNQSNSNNFKILACLPILLPWMTPPLSAIRKGW